VVVWVGVGEAGKYRGVKVMSLRVTVSPDVLRVRWWLMQEGWKTHGGNKPFRGSYLPNAGMDAEAIQH